MLIRNTTEKKCAEKYEIAKRPPAFNTLKNSHTVLVFS